MSRETNFKPLLKKPKPPSNPKKAKFSVFKSKLLKPSKTLKDVLPKRTKKLIIPEEMAKELLNPCNLLSTLKSEPVVKPSESRRRWNLTSTILKYNLDMPTDSALKPKRL